MIFFASVLLLSAAQAPSMPTEAEQRRTATEVLEQLVAEDGNLAGSRDYRGHDHVLIQSHPRASEQGGLCEFDLLVIERAAAEMTRPAGSSTIRSVETKSWFYVLTNESEQPSWEIQGEEQERRCAAIHPDDHRWFEADDENVAHSVVSGLFTLVAELRKPRSRLIEWRHCAIGGECPNRSELAERIDPLNPGMARLSIYQRCPEGRWCVSTLLDNPGCGAWSAQLLMDGVHTDRLMMARIDGFVGALHCGEQAMEVQAATGE